MGNILNKTQQYEGWRDRIYKDSVGKRTIGYGFNIDDPTVANMLHKDVLSGKIPLDKNTADVIFQNLNDRAIGDSIKFMGDKYDSLDASAKFILNDMAYNMGIDRLSKFKNFRDNLQRGDFAGAAREIENSK